jgi:hypothetical protein
VYLAGGPAKEVDNGVLVFVIFCLDRNSDRSIGKDSTANANSRVKILHKFAKRVIINNIEGVIADNDELN